MEVIAGEPQGADDAFRSRQSDRLIPQTSPNTIADGLLTSMSELTWSFVRGAVQKVMTVSDPQIVAAMKLFVERTKILIEPSAAVPVAVCLGDEFRSQYQGQRIGVILSGGNVDLDKLPW